MDVKMIEAIAGLWELALILLVIVFLLIFRKQLKILFERITQIKVKKGNAELTISQKQPEAPEESLLQQSEEKAIVESSKKDDDAKLIASEPRTSSQLRTEITTALTQHKKADAYKSFDELQKKETDDGRKLFNEVWFYWTSYDAGDASAIPKLIQLTKKEFVAQIANHVLAECYYASGIFDKAAGAYEKSAAIIEKPDERASEIVLVAQSLYNSGKKAESFARLMKVVSSSSSMNEAAILYEGLASLYELDKNAELRALALEKALECKPNDIDLNFAAAYSFSHAEHGALALLYYQTLLRFDPKAALALNNMGVQCSLLGLPFHSVSYYKKSVADNNTLAAANLAYVYMKAGMESEASQVLNDAKMNPELHPNVGNALATLSGNLGGEKEKIEGIISDARKQQRFFSLFADAYFKEQTEIPNLAGIWESDNGLIITFVHNNGRLEADYVSQDKKFRIEGVIFNRAIFMTTYKMNYNLFMQEEIGYIKDGRGYGYSPASNESVLIMIIKDNKYSFITLLRP